MAKRVPTGLAQVRKALPPPSRIIEARKGIHRRRVKEALRRELKDALPF